MSEIVSDLSLEDLKFAEENLNESQENRVKYINEIKIWFETTIYSSSINKIESNLILAFLRCCKFNINKTKEKLLNYFKLRFDTPEWFHNRNPHLVEIEELLKLGVFVPLRRHNQHNQMVVIIRVAAHNSNYHKQNDIFKVGKMILDIAVLMEMIQSQIYGVVAIFDMKDISLGHVRQLTPSMIKKAVFAWQNYHCRPKRLEFINAPTTINVVLNIFKQFMSAKLKNRIQIHYNGLDNLYQYVSNDILPSEYGGNGEDFKETIQYWHNKVISYNDWFVNDENNYKKSE